MPVQAVCVVLTLCTLLCIILLFAGGILTLCTAPGLHTFYAFREHDTRKRFIHSICKIKVIPGQTVFLSLGLHNTYYPPLYSYCDTGSKKPA